MRPVEPSVRRAEWRFTRASLAIWILAGTVTTVLTMRGAIAVATSAPAALRVAVEFTLLVLAFEAYFYLVHRLLHTRLLFRRVHAVHHRSKTPTVLSALSLHPVEALLIAGFLPVAMALVEMHLASIVLASLYLSASIALAHCGYRVFPHGFERLPLLNLYVTPLVHDAHHAKVDVNYGATLSLFDRALGTFLLPEERPRSGPPV